MVLLQIYGVANNTMQTTMRIASKITSAIEYFPADAAPFPIVSISFLNLFPMEISKKVYKRILSAPVVRNVRCLVLEVHEERELNEMNPFNQQLTGLVDDFKQWLYYVPSVEGKANCLTGGALRILCLSQAPVSESKYYYREYTGINHYFWHLVDSLTSVCIFSIATKTKPIFERL